jgi:hypothetical protein
MEKKKRSRDSLVSFNPDPNTSTEEAKSVYKPSTQRIISFTKAQIGSATRHLAHNGLNEKRRKLTSGEFAPFEEKSTLTTITSSPKHFERRRASIEYYLYRLFGSIPERNWQKVGLH